MLATLRLDEELAQAYPHPERFTGGVRHQWITQELGSAIFNGTAVFFEAGARARPHSHPVEQLLYFVRGEGVVAVDGGPDQLVPEGSLVVLPAGTPHMHGASDAGPACHLTVTPAPTQTDWLTDVPPAWHRFLSPGAGAA